MDVVAFAEALGFPSNERVYAVLRPAWTRRPERHSMCGYFAFYLTGEEVRTLRQIDWSYRLYRKCTASS